jgi:exodeoxyribonuclease VIII
VKARPDAFCENYAIDVKTTENASPESFKRSIYNYGYHVQAAMIQDALREVCSIDIKHYIFIIIENNAPFASATYILDNNAIEKGRQVYKNCLLNLKECIMSNTWPAYETQIIDLPTWAY